MVSINAKLLEQKKTFNYTYWIGLEHKHGHRDVMCKLSEKCYGFFWGGEGGGGAGEVNKGQGYNKLEYDLPA